jgi:hypothetical protein
MGGEVNARCHADPAHKMNQPISLLAKLGGSLCVVSGVLIALSPSLLRSAE